MWCGGEAQIFLFQKQDTLETDFKNENVDAAKENAKSCIDGILVCHKQRSLEQKRNSLS